MRLKEIKREEKEQLNTGEKKMDLKEKKNKPGSE